MGWRGLEVEGELVGGEEAECGAVVGGGAVLADGLAVGFGGVAFVDVPGVLWVEVV